MKKKIYIHIILLIFIILLSIFFSTFENFNVFTNKEYYFSGKSMNDKELNKKWVILQSNTPIYDENPLYYESFENQLFAENDVKIYSKSLNDKNTGNKKVIFEVEMPPPTPEPNTPNSNINTMTFLPNIFSSTSKPK